MVKSLLIYGGTFDPPHIAHATLPPLVASLLGMDRVLYVPTSLNPLKVRQPTLPEHRLEMLRLALRTTPQARIDDAELRAEGPSYTVDTLTRIRAAEEDDVELRFLLGADSALTFPRWKEPRRILELARPVVMVRPPLDVAMFNEKLIDVFGPTDAKRWQESIIEVPRIDVSSSDLRRRLGEGRPIAGRVDPEVERYIREHGLYGAAGTVA